MGSTLKTPVDLQNFESNKDSVFNVTIDYCGS